MALCDYELDVMFAEMNGLPVPGAVPLKPLSAPLALFAEPAPVTGKAWGEPRHSDNLSEAQLDAMFAAVNGIGGQS